MVKVHWRAVPTLLLWYTQKLLPVLHISAKKCVYKLVLRRNKEIKFWCIKWPNGKRTTNFASHLSCMCRKQRCWSASTVAVAILVNTFNETRLLMHSWNIFIVISCKMTKCVSIYRIACLSTHTRARMQSFTSSFYSIYYFMLHAQTVDACTWKQPEHSLLLRTAFVFDGKKGENSTRLTLLNRMFRSMANICN